MRELFFWTSLFSFLHVCNGSYCSFKDRFLPKQFYIGTEIPLSLILHHYLRGNYCIFHLQAKLKHSFSNGLSFISYVGKQPALCPVDSCLLHQRLRPQHNSYSTWFIYFATAWYNSSTEGVSSFAR